MDNIVWNPTWMTIKSFSEITPLDLFHKEQAQSQYIQKSERENVHVLCRTKFYAEENEEYTLRITADDHYRLYLDGEFVQEGPAPSDPSHYFYENISLRKLSKGPHLLAVHVYYQGCVNRVFYSGDQRLAFLAELRDLGGKLLPLTWKAMECDAWSGEKIGYETQFLENIDQRKYPKNWFKEIDFDDQKWEEMVKARWADYQLTKQPTKALSHTKITPLTIKKESAHRYLIDVGREMTGWLFLSAKGQAGSKIWLLFGEEMEQECVRYDMRCNCTYRECWILDEGLCELEPYDYKGFRYVEILSEEGVEIKELRLEERGYPFDENACELETDQKYVKEIFEICKRAVRLGTQDAYLDCPTREKGQYLGDAIVTSHAHLLLTGETEMLKKCIAQFAETARICPGLMAVAPGCHNVINALYLGSMKMANEMAQIIGEKEPFSLEKRIETFIHVFYREDTGLFADSETSDHSALHSNVYLLYFDLVPKEKTKKILSFLIKKGFCCGVMLSYFVLFALAKHGRKKEALKLLLNEGEHGWVQMLREGATTCFEAWGKEQKWNTSLCHPWASAPVSFLIEEILGFHLNPKAEAGFVFAPDIPEKWNNISLKICYKGKQYLIKKTETDTNITEENR